MSLTDQPPTRRYADIEGLRISYQRAGEGPLLVLVHGAACDGRVWRRQLDDFADELTVVAWDAPGCGQSTDPPESFRLPEYADALAGLIRSMDAGPPHVLGHSFGGALALELYRRHPTVPASLILVGGYAGWAGSLSPAEVERRLQFAIDAADSLPRGFEPTSMPGLFSNAMSDDTARELATIMSEIRPVATRAMARALAEADLRDVLPTIAVPTLLLYGDADVRSPLDIAESLHRSIPASQLIVLPGLGHESFLEAPERISSEVRRFVRLSPTFDGGSPSSAHQS